jgi:type II secretory pathway pseudopilin PulG
VTAINTKYLGGYRTEKLARVKAMRFYLGYINHLGRLQKKSARLVRQAHQPVRQAGFTITEVLLASSMMLIAISVAGIGVTNLLRSNYRANAGTEIQNNLNRTLEFVSDEVRRARIIADSETAITSTQVPTGARAVLAFQIPNPNNPGQILPDQIVYYTKGPENSLTGPRVLWRYGPNLDANGNYITPADVATWISSPVTDRLAAPAPAPDGICPEDFNLIAVNPNPVVDGFYACVRAGGNQVILNANAEVNLTTGDTDKDKVKYSVSTRVSPRATN